jgi:hypothetical protein
MTDAKRFFVAALALAAMTICLGWWVASAAIEAAK